MATIPNVMLILLSSLPIASIIKYTSPIILVHRSIVLSTLVLSSILLASLALWKYILYPKLFSPLRDLPGPTGGSFFHGQLWRILAEPVGAPMREWINEIPNNGMIRFTTVFNQERLLLTSPETLSEVLVSKSYDWEKPKQMRQGLGRILGIGVLLATGEDHKMQRKNLAPGFSYRRIKNLYPVFWSKASEMVQTVHDVTEAEFEKSDDRNSAPIGIPMNQWLRRVTLDIIGIAGLGCDFGAIYDPGTAINKAYHRLFAAPGSDMAIALLETMENLFPVSLLAKLPLKQNKEITSAASMIRILSRTVIREHHRRLHGPSENFSLVKDILSIAQESGYFSEDDLVDQSMTILAAGHETTSTATTWALIALCQHPDFQTRLRAEIHTELSFLRIDPSATVTADQIEGLSYLHAFCNELLRFYAPIPLSRRECVRDTTIIGRHIPKGSNILLVPAAVNLSKQLWGEDALEFNPDRWIGPNRANSGGANSNYANLTFMHGPRSCIGASLARAELKCLLVAIVGHFHLAFADRHPRLEIAQGVTLRLKGDLLLKLVPCPRHTDEAQSF